MTQLDLSDRFDPAAVEDYRQQAHVFLEKARQYLLEDDLHQASEKGWGAAAWMVKAVAVNQGWEYESHPQFSVVMYSASVQAKTIESACWAGRLQDCIETTTPGSFSLSLKMCNAAWKT